MSIPLRSQSLSDVDTVVPKLLRHSTYSHNKTEKPTHVHTKPVKHLRPLRSFPPRPLNGVFSLLLFLIRLIEQIVIVVYVVKGGRFYFVSSTPSGLVIVSLR